MKRIIFLVAAMLFGAQLSTLSAQEESTPKQKEFYLTLTSFDPLIVQIKYKHQLAKKTFFKAGLIDLGVGMRKITPNDPGSYIQRTTSFSAGTILGVEFRAKFNDRFTLYHGPGLGYSYWNNVTREENPVYSPDQQKRKGISHQGAFIYSCGLLFNINDHFLIAAEINPSVGVMNYRFTDGANPYNNSKSLSSYLDINNGYGYISLVYRL